MEKTNAIRLLDQAKIEYKIYTYVLDGNTDGEHVASLIKVDHERVFKTLVTISNNRMYFVFMIPVSHNLDLKKAAKAVDVKSIEMIKQKDLLPLTGYVHGGCSPIGMKKSFITIVDETALKYPTIVFSAGKIGKQIEIFPRDLEKIIDVKFCDIIIDK